jgi:hypothetical protein
VLQCIENGDRGTLVARRDGSRVLIDRSYGESVNVFPF